MPLIGLTTSVSAEVASQGIRGNLRCPGIIDTPMHQRLRELIGDDVYDKGVLPQIHLKRAGAPEEIAKTVVSSAPMRAVTSPGPRSPRMVGSP